MININARPGRLVLTPRHQSSDDAGGLLRRYGLAVVRDNRLICDERSAAVLVDNLSRRAALAVRNGEGPSRGDSRLRLFSLFIRLHRRHARMAAMEDGFGDFLPLHGAPGETDSHERASNLERAIRNLPLELRESLLLVVLERFSHSEAAEALDIPLATLMDRLARARATLAAGLSQRRPAPSRNPPSGHAWRRGAPHLRLVK
jgi:RNA polymerase sigma-70 factor (ECF subfamily)